MKYELEVLMKYNYLTVDFVLNDTILVHKAYAVDKSSYRHRQLSTHCWERLHHVHRGDQC